GEGNLDEELGDLLFACVNLVRLHKRDPEEVLNAATEKFLRRFSRMEALTDTFEGKSLAELDELWEIAKQSNH
ncbi:MAG: MazG nucleotide pyrophosphohydrolase domain-containing protein, partial [bacterium]